MHRPLLPLVLARSADEAQPPEETPDSAPTADSELSFTVLSNGELATATMDEWLPGVVAAEMPALFETEALKAQAVAARTYILSRRRTGTLSHPDADVCDDPSCCKAHLTSAELMESWGDNYDEYMSCILAAVRATDGEILTYEDVPIQAVFHSSSAGMTEDSGAVWNALPYLVSVSSPETSADVPNYVTTLEVSVTNFAATLRAANTACDLSGTPDTWVSSLTEDESGRVGEAVIGGATLTGAEVRSLFELRSAAFTLEYTDGAFLFTVTGYGHGVGMSQYGANVMAREGSSYAEILAHYYPGTVLVS